MTGKVIIAGAGPVGLLTALALARQDGRTAVFQVTALEQVPKAHFPTKRVYGPTTDPTIRLMTCGGTFNPAKHSYNDNIIVYGVLVGWTMT